MESLREILSPYDNLDIYCEDHGIPCLGICSNYLCKDEVKFFCMKCIKTGETCITKQKHELITLGEMLFRFFVKDRDQNLLEIKEMYKIAKGYTHEEINSVENKYGIVKSENNVKMEEIRLSFLDIINNFIEIFNQKNNEKLKELKDIFNSKKDIEKDFNFLLGIKMPEVDSKTLDNNQKMIEFMNEGYKLTSPQHFINSVKFLYNSNYFMKTSDKLNKIIYYNNISEVSSNPHKKEELEKKIDSVLEELELNFDKKINQIEAEIIIPKEDPSVYFSPSYYSKFATDPKDFVFKEDLCSTAHKSNSIDGVFCAFKKYSGESLVVWGTQTYNIDIYDLEKGKVIKTIQKAHTLTIFACRHYSDNRKRIDYVITSSYDKSVKVWEFNTYTNVVTIKNAHNGSNIYSVSVLCDYKDNVDYVITSAPNEYMRVWDFSGKKIRTMGKNDESTYFIDSYFDNIEKKYYILNANSADVKSYDFFTGLLYKRYVGSPVTWHMSAVINEVNGQQILIESDGNGYIRLWEFHTANLIKSITSGSSMNLRGICLWNDDYLFSSGNDYQVKLFDLKEGKMVKSFKGHSSTVCSVQKIVHPSYGECFISHGLDGKLKVWVSPKVSNK